MYYLIETTYAGPDQANHTDTDRIEISTAPATKNINGEKCVEGWCGTNNDWSIYAHGEYATITEARAAITKKFGVVRDSDILGDRLDSDAGDVIEVYKPGKYMLMSSAQTADWVYELISSTIEAKTTDERIAELMAECEEDANENGFTLHGDLECFFLDRRRELRRSQKRAIRRSIVSRKVT